MSMDEILDAVRTFDGILELAPTEGSEFPEIAWDDHFFYYAPDGEIPPGQPYATIVTKDYPDDTLSDLDQPGRWRLNIHLSRDRFTELTGHPPRAEPGPVDFAVPDVLLPHPVYQAQGWVAIVDPGPASLPLALELLREAHDDARHRTERRTSRS